MPHQIAAGRLNESPTPTPTSFATKGKMRAPFRRPSVRSLLVPLCVVLLFFATASWFGSIDWNGAHRRRGTGCVASAAERQSPGERQPSDGPARSPGNAIDLRKVSDDAYARSYNEAASFRDGACRKPSPSSADIDTLDVFPQLNFQPDYMQRREFWDSTLEKRYTDYKKDTSRPPLKVIILPHSHVDPGWLKTFDDYYAQQTRSILDNLAAKLTEHKNMTFIWTEIAYFSIWWDSALPAKRRQIKQLADEGRLEFTSGTWVMTDEATPHLYSMLDQMIEGHQWLKSNLGISPKSAWSVDPFGHGPVAPYLLRASGLRNTVVQRIHYGWKRWFADKQVSDFYWRMPWASGGSSEDVLCHNFPYDIYSVKHSCGPNPKTCLAYDFRNIRGEYNEFTMNSVPITRTNVQKKSEVLLEQYAKTGSLTRHNVVLALIGDDFRFDHDIEWDQQYYNYQNMFNYINANRDVYGVEIGFGTLTDYFDAVRSRLGTDFPAVKGDLFPYADIFSEGRPAYWTGYYTSRAFYKALAREVEAHLRGAEILYTLALNRARQYGLVSAGRIMDHDYGSLVQARRSLALFQHHDAITGTSKAFVMRDYGEKLFAALKKASAIESRSASVLLTGDDEQWRKFRLLPAMERPSFEKLPQRLVLDLADAKQVFKTVVLYNSDPHHRHEFVRVKLNWPYVAVVDPDNQTVQHQVNPVWTLQRHHRLEHSPETFQVVFIAPLAPLSLTSFRIYRLEEADVRDTTKTLVYSTFPNDTLKGPFQSKGMEPLADIQVENTKMKLLFDGATGFLKSIRSKATNKSTACSMQFAAYPSSMFHSGAYLFMPDPNSNEPHIDVFSNPATKPQVFIISGPVMSEVSVVYSQLLVHSTIIFHKKLDDLIWMESTMDMGPAPNYRDREFFIRFKTGVRSNRSPNGTAEFFTDQNGFAFARRTRVESLGVEANYYPITSAAYIQDEQQRLSLLVNRAKGFTSLHPGWMEFMVDRRTIHDDGRGMGEGMTDNYPTVTPFVLMLEERNGLEAEVPALSLAATHTSSMLTYPAASFVVHSDSEETAASLAASRMLLLSQPLPCNVQLVGLRSLSDRRLMDADLPSNSALMTLHNRAFDCSVKGELPLCGSAEEGDQVFYRDTSFVGLYTLSLQRTTLTGIDSLGTVDFNTARVPLMELGSFNLTFA